MTATAFSFDDSTHTYRDSAGVAIPSVTQVLDGVGLVDYSEVPEKRLEFKRKIGDAVHYAARYLDQDNLDYSTIQPAWAGYLTAYVNFLDETEFKVEKIEHSGIYTYAGMRYAYTWDRLGRFPKLKYRTLLEIKCTAAEEASWPVQLAGYELTVEKAQDEHITRVALQLKPDGKYKLYNYEDGNDQKVFLWALALTAWKIKHNVAWRSK